MRSFCNKKMFDDKAIDKGYEVNMNKWVCDMLSDKISIFIERHLANATDWKCLFLSENEILWKIRIAKPVNWCPAHSIPKKMQTHSTWKRVSRTSIQRRYCCERHVSVFRKSWSGHRPTIRRNAVASIPTKRSHWPGKRKWLICKRYRAIRVKPHACTL